MAFHEVGGKLAGPTKTFLSSSNNAILQKELFLVCFPVSPESLCFVVSPSASPFSQVKYISRNKALDFLIMEAQSRFTRIV